MGFRTWDERGPRRRVSVKNLNKYKIQPTYLKRMLEDNDNDIDNDNDNDNDNGNDNDSDSDM